MKSIVIDARISGTTTGRYVDKLIEYLHELNPEEKFIVLTRPNRVDAVKSFAPNFEVVASEFPDFSLGEQLGLKKQLKGLKPDLVHFPMVQQPILYRGPVVTSMLDLTTLRFTDPTKNIFVFKTKQQVYKIVNRIAAKKSKHIITISNFVKSDIVKSFRISESKITTTYNSADKIPDEPEAVPNVEAQNFLLYVGRPQAHKNLGRLIEAFAILHEKDPELQLVLAGKKDVLFDQHEARANELGLKDSVVFTDFVSEGQLRWLYENCAAYVFPSLSEGFGLPGLEAMIHGAPVVSSNATCLPEIYGDAAHYFNPTDVNDMALKISEVLDGENFRNSLIQKGYAQVAKYSWERMAKQTLEIYRKVLDS
jgi:glycosyltransferase involved in cell wall biosynthesis